MSVRRSLSDVGFKVLNTIHRTILHASGGRVGRSAFGMTVVELHTIGARSGLARTTVLTAPVVEGDRYVLVASKGGADRDPDWCRNVVAHPDVELTIRGVRRSMRAHLASAQEEVDLWPRIIAAYRPYGRYRARATRHIPLVICAPR
jgi:deazaflavin-dependent oxidoreductase (nitroreductase family)